MPRLTAALLFAALAGVPPARAASVESPEALFLAQTRRDFEAVASTWAARHETLEAARRWLLDAERRGWTLEPEPRESFSTLQPSLEGTSGSLHGLWTRAGLTALSRDMSGFLSTLGGIFGRLVPFPLVGKPTPPQLSPEAQSLRSEIEALIEKVEADEVLVRELGFRAERLGAARLPPPAMRSAGPSTPSAGEGLPGLETQGAAEAVAVVRPVPSEPKPRVWGPRAQEGLLAAVDKIEAGGLSPVEEEALVRAQPMGELIWSMQAHKLWEKGLDGRGVKVAVLDGGVAEHPGLDESVKARETYVGRETVEGDHGTSVAAVIHSLAPRAEIRSYKVLPGWPFWSDASVKAIDQAVQDGNRIVNMSYGAHEHIEHHRAFQERMRRYARDGVIFIGAAGNEGVGGLIFPGSDPAALAVGAVDYLGRMAGFSSHGLGIDGDGKRVLVKALLMAPGVDVMSAYWRPLTGETGFEPVSGTSFAAPAVAGAAAQLLPAARGVRRLVTRALLETGDGLRRDDLPAHQRYYIVRPYKAYRRLVGE